MAEVTEEHSILRVTDPDLAGALRECLDTGTEEDVKSAKIVFEGTMITSSWHRRMRAWAMEGQ